MRFVIATDQVPEIKLHRVPHMIRLLSVSSINFSSNFGNMYLMIRNMAVPSIHYTPLENHLIQCQFSTQFRAPKHSSLI